MKRILSACCQLCSAALFYLAACQAHAESPLPEVTLIDFATGQQISTAQLKGQVVYLDFWASWCKPCKKSFPFMNELQKKYATEDFKVVAINMDEFADDAKRFLAEIPADFAIYTDPEKQLAESLKLPGLPVAFVIDKDGIIRGRHIGFNERKKQKKIQQIEHLIGTP
ncbi:TlpA family protein disulfide reductase [Planctobacterium marinum]|uniref:TlpA family protein disulfide reductase n=1 Tax=Planctobacterium marinum TaxID=1631968 RepID=UPI001E3DBDD1|nr:TlpA disulfide reductase family protein [Planctobacterium marinum]MCC2603794.1 TlpA family protein disulfide reductase [Planctobacterium marinum]